MTQRGLQMAKQNLYQSVQVFPDGRSVAADKSGIADELIAAGDEALENWARWSRRGAAAYGQHSPQVPWAGLYDASAVWDSTEERAADVEAEAPVDDQAAEWLEAAIVLEMAPDMRRVVCAAYLGSGTSRQRAGKLRLSLMEYRTGILSACRWVGRALAVRAI